MTLGLDHTAAPGYFAQLCGGGSLIACNPLGPDKKPVRVIFDLAHDGDHYLFKSSGDTHGRAHPHLQRREDFLLERSDRMGWIPEVLERPDSIYADKQENGTFLYVCRTLAGEEFAVIIHRVNAPNVHYFVTGYVLDQDAWAVKKRTRLTKSYPRKSKTSKKKKGTV